MKQTWLVTTMLAIVVSQSACAERAEIVEYNPNAPTQVPATKPAPEVGLFGYVNDKFHATERQMQDNADRLDRLERDLSQLKTLEVRVADLEKKLAALASQSSGAAASSSESEKSDSKAVKATLSAADQEAAGVLYKKGFDQLMAGKYAEAGKLFKEYVDKYPDAEQASNANYWLGESYYVGRKFDLAVKSFDAAARLNGPKAADALLKQGQCYIELKKNKEAKLALDSLKEQYPDSEAAKQAGKLLSSLKAADTKK